MRKVQIKPTAIPRAGYDYQDLVGIDLLISHYRDPDLYEWVLLEADDTDFRALDDAVALRKDGSYELVQVKFTVDSDRYELDWDWLLKKTKKGTSMLEKWAKSLAHLAAIGTIYSAGLKTNRIPSAEFAKCLVGMRVDFDLLSREVRELVEVACGGTDGAKTFFQTFDFMGGLLDIDGYENYLRDQLVPTDTDSLGWLAFRHNVRRWATFNNQPEPDGRIFREHVVQLITKRRPQPIRQNFIVPDCYGPPSKDFDESVRERILKNENPITILWGTPGRGKSTYLSYLTQELQQDGAAVIRHHYFLAADDSSSNRFSFTEISNSLISQFYVHYTEAMMGVVEDIDNLRATIQTAAAKLADNGQRLYIIVDGLDHVWRDTQRVDQLNHLFNELLPLPQNVSLIIGTQRVSDEQLPGKLLTIAEEHDWFEIPRMNEVAVHRWVIEQENIRPLILRFNPEAERRTEIIEEIAAAFFSISQGHPLHLIYAYEGLIHAGRPTFPDEILTLPPCPDGDIRTYYQGLWVRLRADAKNILHMLAGSDFFWPSPGIRRVLGDFSQIDYLLEPRNVGMVPFHSSIFAWVRERKDHTESYQALLPKIINWLVDDAPKYWRWGWLWLAKAQGGDFEDLLSGVTRDWVVESLSKGWSDQQIENIIAVAEAKTFEDGDLPRTVYLRGLKTRVSNAREFQSQDFATYRATALAVSENRQQTLNLLDDIHDLSDSEVAALARLGPDELSTQTMQACLDELSRRVNAWIELRHRPGREFTELSDYLLSVSALMEHESVERTLNYTRRFENPEPHVSMFISLLGDAQNIEGLQLAHNMLTGDDWEGQRLLIHDSIVRAAAFAGADARAIIPLDNELLSAFVACWLIWRGHNEKLDVHIPPVPENVFRERYSYDDNGDVSSYFYEAFWTMLYVGCCANGNDYSLIHPGFERDDLGWLPQGITKLEGIARGITKGLLTPAFSTVYAETVDIKPVKTSPAPARDNEQYRAFKEALRRIAVDLHYLGLADLNSTKVPAAELSIARQSAHWSDEVWMTRNVSNRISLLDKEGAGALLTDQQGILSAKVTEFMERSGHWTLMADFARLYEDERQGEFLMHASECLIGYGWRKDLSASDVLDAIAELSTKDQAVTLTRLDKLAPIIDVITDFTDGDETNYLRSEFIWVVAKTAPERLPSLYEHHLSADDYSYADECLIKLVEMIDLEPPECAALARTFLDDLTLGALESRAVSEPLARTLLGNQNTFLGRTPKNSREIKLTEMELSEREKEAAEVDPTSFNCDDFIGVVEAVDGIHYRNREEFMVKWLRHWKEQGKALHALRAIRTYFDTSERTLNAEEILAEAFLVSLASEGKDKAYPWLVKTHIHRHGWSSYFASEAETMARIELAARYYPDRWFQYIMDTSVPAPYYRRQGYSFVLGYKYLVRFLMLVGQVELADRVTTSLVNTLVDEVREQPIPETPWFC